MPGEIKVCTLCNRPGEFYKNGRGGLRNDCVDCVKARVAERQRKHADWLRATKLNRGCDRCGYRRCARALHFHHRDPDTKINCVGMMTNESLRRMKEEISKCDLLCANCHAETHE